MFVEKVFKVLWYKVVNCPSALMRVNISITFFNDHTVVNFTTHREVCKCTYNVNYNERI